MDLFTISTARFSPCRTYRYRLSRIWDKSKASACFLMLNPSTADETQNDPTVERCQRRAVAMGYGGLEICNLFALRSTDPAGLYSCADPVGPENDQAIVDACSGAGIVIAAWGKHGNHLRRQDHVLSLIRGKGVALHYLALNGDGTPKHPLYVAYANQPVRWE